MSAAIEPTDVPMELRQEFRDAVQTLSNARRAEAWATLFKAVRWALDAAAPAAPREPVTDDELLTLGQCAVRGYLDFEAARKWFANRAARETGGLVPPQPEAVP